MGGLAHPEASWSSRCVTSLFDASCSSPSFASGLTHSKNWKSSCSTTSSRSCVARRAGRRGPGLLDRGQPAPAARQLALVHGDARHCLAGRAPQITTGARRDETRGSIRRVGSTMGLCEREFLNLPIRWHRQGRRLLWRWKSRPDRPPIPVGLLRSIMAMACANPTWARNGSRMNCS
jgi:hypothetical protein